MGSPTILNQQISSFYTLKNLQVPAEGPRAVPIPLDFTATSTYTLNLQNMIARGFLSLVQALFVDNSANTESLSIFFPNTNQTLTFEAGEQGYMTCLCQNPATMNFTSTGGTSGVTVFLLNFPVSNSVWQANPDAAIALPARVTYSGGVVEPQLVANEMISNHATNSVAAIVTGAPGYYVGGFSMQLTSNSTLTSGTDLQITLVDSVSGIIATINLSPANGLFGGVLGFFWNSKSTTSTLSLDFSTSLSAGEAFYNINYGITKEVF